MHLVVLAHGMWGVPSHMRAIAKAIEEKLENVVVFNSSANRLLYSYHGIDYCGVRIYNDSMKFIRDYNDAHEEKINKISFIGYSAGGLYCRYCIGIMESNNVFKDIIPSHFITVATPHMGIRSTSRTLPGRFVNFVKDCVIFLYAGRTGTQLILKDTDGDFPLLQEMSHHDTVYIKGLSRFRVILYANANNDRTVPFSTAGLDYNNKWKAVDRTKEMNIEGFEYVLCKESIGSNDHMDYFIEKLAENRKSYDYAILDVLYALFLVLIITPLILIHMLIFIVPLKLWSLSFEYPVDLSPLLKRQELQTASPESEAAPVDIEISPFIILYNMRKLPITRVVVYIPSGHTHGLIINRRYDNPYGSEVIRHLVDHSFQDGLSDDADGNEKDNVLSVKDINVETKL